GIPAGLQTGRGRRHPDLLRPGSGETVARPKLTVDRAFALLHTYLGGGGQTCLLVADENLGEASFNTIDSGIDVISNRFDIAHSAQNAGLQTHFNDFDFSGYPANHFARLCYRLSKEKAVVEHVIRQALRVLQVEGELILCGAKNEGLKRFAKYAAQLFQGSADIRKTGSLYLARITKNGNEASTQPPPDDYGQTLPVEVDLEDLGLPSLQGRTRITLASKAGMFGAGRIDAGSAMLAACMPAFFAGFDRAPRSLLDLGCGYGYLSVCAGGFGFERIVATDNCAAAIEACKKNAATSGLPIEVIADDCAGSIRDPFDVVLCNPPFHRGFKADSRLGLRFLQTAANRLKPHGQALFVVNQFIPLEKLAASYFESLEVIARDPSFKLMTLSRPRLRY
ncbi:MAG TPA: hypothetical protein DIT58_08320, partial [Porticoccaceae bacterium]|nr:hypothetical protein [Porticoccaceae bacterium]